MTCKNCIICLIVVINACTGVKAASEPNECAWMAGTFSVVSSTVPVEWSGRWASSPPPAFCASVIMNTNDWSSVAEQIPKTQEWNTLSKAQHEFCKQTHFYQHHGSCSGIYEEYQRFHLYAVTEEDAQKLAAAFLKIKAAQAMRSRSEHKQEIQSRKAELAKAEADLPLKQAEFTAVKQQYEKVKSNVRYVSLSNDKIAQTAEATILRMNSLMDEVDIDRVAAEARIHAIQQQLKRIDGNELLQTPLELQLIQQTIELTGLEARKLSALKTLEQQNGFITLFQSYADLAARIHRLEGIVDEYPAWLTEEESLLAGPHRFLAPPLAGNRVTIHPVDVPKPKGVAPMDVQQ